MKGHLSSPAKHHWILCCAVVLFLQTAPAQQRGHFRVTVSTDAVHLLVADHLGRRAGSDPRGAPDPLIGIGFDEIPGGEYAAETVGDIPDKEGDTARVDYVHVLTYTFDDPIDGTHVIQAIGVKNSLFDLYLTVTPDDAQGGPQYFRAKVRGLVQKDSVVVYRLHYQSHPGRAVTFEKIVTLNTLRQDLAVAHAENELGDTKLLDEWNKAIERTDRRLADRDSIKARQEMERFDRSLDKEYLQTENQQRRGHKEKRYITKVAYDILKTDVSVLLDLWPTGNGK
jgi:hypothetical protein